MRDYLLAGDPEVARAQVEKWMVIRHIPTQPWTNARA